MLEWFCCGMRVWQKHVTVACKPVGMAVSLFLNNSGHQLLLFVLHAGASIQDCAGCPASAEPAGELVVLIQAM